MRSVVDRAVGQESATAAPYLNLLVTMVLFGSAFASSKVVVGQISHEVAAALRFGGGGLILLVLAGLLRGRSRPLGKAMVVRAGLVSLIGVLGYNVLFFWGLSLAPSLDGSIIVPVLSPILTTAGLILMRKEKASWERLTGLSLGMAGALVFFLGIAGNVSEATRLGGDFLFVLGAGCWAAYSILSKSLLEGADPLRATACGTGVGALALILFAVPTVGDVAWDKVSDVTWANVVFLAVGPTALAYLFYYRGLRSLSPATATIMMFTVPVFGAFFSTLFLGESFTGLQIVGAVIMLGGALFAVVGLRPFRRFSACGPATEG